MKRVLLLCAIALLQAGDARAVFTEVTEVAFGVPPADIPGWACAHWPDYNNDGWPDLHIDRDILYANNGDGTFTQVTGSGLDVEHGGSYRATWADADNDGDLDCAQASYSNTSPETVHKGYYYENTGAPDFTFTRHVYYEQPLNTRCGNPLFVDGDSDGFYEIYQATFGNWAPDYGRTHDRYFEADGGELWTDVTATVIPELMTVPYERHSRSVVACDWGNTGNIDIFVPVYGVDWADPSWENMLWRNYDGAYFADYATEAGVAIEPHGQYGVGLASGASWGDYDNDGDFDLAVANIHGWTALYRNGGWGSFTNVTEEAGLYTASNQEWHNTAWIDLDNDGDLDLIATAWYDRVAFLYENEGPENLGHFHIATNDFGFNPIGEFKGIDGGVGAAGYDRDGDLDVFFEGGNGAYDGKHLFRNDLDPESAEHHWLVLQLQGNGTSCALTAAGAQVRIFHAGGSTGLRQVETTSADMCMHMHPVHFGLDEQASVISIEVKWPDRSLEYWFWEDIGEAVDQWLTLVQGEGTPATAVDLGGTIGGALAIDGIFPNPAARRATCVLSSRREGRAELALYDVAGRRLRDLATRLDAGGAARVDLDVADLPAGLYLLRGRQGGETATAKLFVLR